MSGENQFYTLISALLVVLIAAIVVWAVAPSVAPLVGTGGTVLVLFIREAAGSLNV